MNNRSTKTLSFKTVLKYLFVLFSARKARAERGLPKSDALAISRQKIWHSLYYPRSFYLETPLPLSQRPYGRALVVLPFVCNCLEFGRQLMFADCFSFTASVKVRETFIKD